MRTSASRNFCRNIHRSPRDQQTLTSFDSTSKSSPPKMHLMYTLGSDGKRIYTLKKIAHGEVTKSAHPARFSPDDKYSR